VTGGPTLYFRFPRALPDRVVWTCTRPPGRPRHFLASQCLKALCAARSHPSAKPEVGGSPLRSRDNVESTFLQFKAEPGSSLGGGGSSRTEGATVHSSKCADLVRPRRNFISNRHRGLRACAPASVRRQHVCASHALRRVTHPAAVQPKSAGLASCSSRRSDLRRECGEDSTSPSWTTDLLRGTDGRCALCDPSGKDFLA
jgi:hypothetical protein